MTVCAIMLVKDEQDIIETTVRHLATQVDEITVADNGSTDGTLDTLHLLIEAGLPLRVEHDNQVGYYQSRKMTALAKSAGERGHEWVVPCDADEIWYSPHGTIADILARTYDETMIVEATLYDHVATGADPDDPDPVKRLGWRRRREGALPKVAVRVKPGLVIEQGNHGAHYPGDVDVWTLALVIRHFPYRSREQMVSKVRNGAAAYAATSLPESYGRHWREYGELLRHGGDEAIHEVFDTWFYVEYPEADAGLIYDPAPV